MQHASLPAEMRVGPGDPCWTPKSNENSFCTCCGLCFMSMLSLYLCFVPIAPYDRDYCPIKSFCLCQDAIYAKKQCKVWLNACVTT